MISIGERVSIRGHFTAAAAGALRCDCLSSRWVGRRCFRYCFGSHTRRISLAWDDCTVGYIIILSVVVGPVRDSCWSWTANVHFLRLALQTDALLAFPVVFHWTYSAVIWEYEQREIERKTLIFIAVILWWVISLKKVEVSPEKLKLVHLFDILYHFVVVFVTISFVWCKKYTLLACTFCIAPPL